MRPHLRLRAGTAAARLVGGMKPGGQGFLFFDFAFVVRSSVRHGSNGRHSVPLAGVSLSPYNREIMPGGSPDSAAAGVILIGADSTVVLSRSSCLRSQSRRTSQYAPAARN